MLRELGRGGMGVVYLAKHRLTHREEALKVVNPRVLGEAGMAERLDREIRLAASLDDKNIVKVHTALRLGKLVVLVMEYVPGENLADVVSARGPRPVVNACYYVQQAAMGLQHAFKKNVVHRDIKPSNLILARHEPVVTILDFGLAKARRETEATTRDLTGSLTIGTPEYMAPEQWEDSAQADIRADIYSLGCTLYFLLTGRAPFPAKSWVGQMKAHSSIEATPLHKLRTDVPAKLAAVVAKMMAKDPAQRYQKPVEVAQALAPFVERKPRTTESKTDGGKGRQDKVAKPVAIPVTMIEGQDTIAKGRKKADGRRMSRGVLPSCLTWLLIGLTLLVSLLAVGLVWEACRRR